MNSSTEKNNKEFTTTAKQKLMQRITELYNRDRSELTPIEKRMFYLPVSQRHKGSMEHMSNWISKVEMILLQKYETQNNRIEQWFSPMPKNWKDEVK